jgi:Poxvirus A22 protein
MLTENATEFIGFDCAYKSLAWSHLSISHLGEVMDMYKELVVAINAIIDPEYSSHINTVAIIICRLDTLLDIARRINAFTRTCIRVISAGVVDLLPGKKVAETTAEERIHALSAWLNKQFGICAHNVSASAIVVIETQPIGGSNNSCNQLSASCEHMLAFFFTSRCKVAFISPKLKNLLAFNGLDFETFRMKYAKPYTARKNHSKENFLYFVKAFHIENILTTTSRPYYDDLADSFNGIIAYIRKERLLW